jgi:transposase
MDVVVERCAGLDVHRDDVVATVRVPGEGRRRWDQQTRTFRATLAGLADLAEWLAASAVTLVGMEATGVYWKTVFQALEERFEWRVSGELCVSRRRLGWWWWFSRGSGLRSGS